MNKKHYSLIAVFILILAPLLFISYSFIKQYIEYILDEQSLFLFNSGQWGDLNPGLDVTADVNETQCRPLRNSFQYSYHINSMGFRGEEKVILNDTWKALFLGDGYAFGTGLSNEQDVASQLALMLRKDYPGRSTAVLNAGMPGYTITDELSYLREKGVAIGPHLVIVIVTPDDVWEIERPVIIREERKRNTNFITDLIYDFRIKRYKLFMFKEYYLNKSRLSEREALKGLIPRYIELAVSFKDKVVENKGRTLFVLWDNPESMLLDAAMKNAGLDYIYIRAPKHIPSIFLADGHWNAEMSRYVAGQIKEWIINEKAL